MDGEDSAPVQAGQFGVDASVTTVVSLKLLSQP